MLANKKKIGTKQIFGQRKYFTKNKTKIWLQKTFALKKYFDQQKKLTNKFFWQKKHFWQKKIPVKKENLVKKFVLVKKKSAKLQTEPMVDAKSVNPLTGIC